MGLPLGLALDFSDNFSYTKKDFKAVSTCFQHVARLVTTFCFCGGEPKEIRSLSPSSLCSSKTRANVDAHKGEYLKKQTSDSLF